MLLRYHYFTREPIVIPKLYSIGYATDTSVTRYGPSRRDQYLIHYIISGKGVFNGTELGRGEGFITYPGMFEHYYPSEKDPWTYLWIISYDPEIEHIVKLHNADKDTGIFKYQNVSVVEDTVRRLLTTEDGFAFSNTEITEMYLSIFNNCVYLQSSAKTGNARMYFDYTVKYVSSNLHLPISVNEICQKLGVSQPYLYKVFMEYAGCSPKQYISECRVEMAKKLLLETDFSVSEVAAAVGYTDVLAFSKFFSAKIKLSPTEFRRKNEMQNT